MNTEPWTGRLAEEIASLLPGRPLEFVSYLGQPFIITPLTTAPFVLSVLKHQLQYDYLVDITAVDHPQRADRFDLHYILYSYSANHRIRIKTAVAEYGSPVSVTDLFPAANWLEREVYDMFGIAFVGHPNMKRILMPEEWAGFPLRKDYSILLQDQDWVQKNLGIESGQ